MRIKEQFKFLYGINYIMFIIIGMLSFFSIIQTYSDYRNYGLNWKTEITINGITEINIRYLHEDILFAMVLLFFTIFTLFNLSTWYQLDKMEIRIVRREKE